MKIPKTLKFAGYNWKIELTRDDNKNNGGSFSWKTKVIKINDNYGEAELILFHEVIEAILTENLTRYYGNEGNTEYKFIFNHTEFCKVVKDIYQVFKDNKFIN